MTDLDKYLQQHFLPLTKGSLGEIVEGQAFLHPLYSGELYEISIYPYRFTDDSSFQVIFENHSPNISHPIYIRLKAQKIVVPAQKTVSKGRKFSGKYRLVIKEWGQVDLATEVPKFFKRRHSITGQLLVNSFSFVNFRNQLLNGISGYKQDFVGEISEELFDGVELESTEDLLPLLVIASPPLSYGGELKPGGFHTVFFGMRVASIYERIRRLTMDPILIAQNRWNLFKPKITDYSRLYGTRPFKSFEYDVIMLRRKGFDNLPNLPFDYPLQIARAPIITDERKMTDFTNPDLVNYLTHLRFIQPKISSTTQEELMKLSDGLIHYAQQREVPEELIGAGKFFDANYYGKPETIFRLALAIARIHDKPVSTDYLRLAKSMLYSSLENTIYRIETDPSASGIKRSEIATHILSQISELSHSYPEGVTVDLIRWKNPYELERWINALLREGVIYENAAKKLKLAKK